MNKVLGIHLGRISSAMATVEDKGNLRVVENSDGDLITASCVEFDGAILIDSTNTPAIESLLREIFKWELEVLNVPVLAYALGAASYATLKRDNKN